MPAAPTAATSEDLVALRTRAALVERLPADVVELAGADRVRFLNGLVTCEVKGVAPGAGRFGFLTDAKGRVLADATLLAFEDRLRLELPAGRGTEIAAHLRKYVIADRVEILERPDLGALALVGPLAASLLGGDLPEADWAHAPREIGGVDVELVREGRLGVVGWSCWLERASLPTVRATLARLPGLVAAAPEALEALRVVAGIGRWGRDFGAEHFPQETGAEPTGVSYTKGCYLGQEIVARIHYRGGVQRALRGLRFAGEPPSLGTVVLAEQRESGTVTSVAVTPELGAIGLAVLHQRVGPAGATVELAGGGEAVVADLPFV